MRNTVKIGLQKLKENCRGNKGEKDRGEGVMEETETGELGEPNVAREQL